MFKFRCGGAGGRAGGGARDSHIKVMGVLLRMGKNCGFGTSWVFSFKT